MVYLFYGLENYLIEKEIKNIKGILNILDISINNYDLDDVLLEDIVDDCLTSSLFEEKKLIVVDNSYIFTGTTNKKNTPQNIEILDKYLDHINENTILIFVINREKIDSRKKIVSKLKKIGIVKEFNKIDDLNKFVSEMFDKYKISNSDINLLIDRVGDNLNLLEQEIKKIKTYKNDDYNITSEDIINLTIENINIDIFELIENIINKNKSSALESYNEMIKLGEEPIKIIIMLANQIRIIYQSKELYKKGYSEKDISNILEIHPYRVKLAISKGYKYDSKILLENLYKLAQIDENIKKGLVNKNNILELFILAY